MRACTTALVALGLSLVLNLLPGPLAGNAVSGIFWFFTYRFTITPVLAVLPVFLALSGLVPLAAYRDLAHFTIAERLPEADA